ncbi:MAG: T9SS type A sorting domain-containing protein [Calditrichaceae bacterium]|nr:T9SS type A sorting domain-containing protein [Calditrichaceae bacterium]MBN2708022.1 T9SS type A sorting domain-containing protein [Calditrichaceae bacterium]RQV93963.1 MAG: T9SS C-terminal target domain-containing protein [Calditrichota bacterium]
MKRITLTILVITISIAPVILYSQDHKKQFVSNSDSLTSLEFYPLQIGNYWIYNDSSCIDICYSRIVIKKVLADTIMPNGNMYYYILVQDLKSVISEIQFERIDSLSGFIYRYESVDSSEWIQGKLYAEPGDTFNTYKDDGFVMYHGETTIQAFGSLKKSKNYTAQYFSYWESYNFVQGLGFYSKEYHLDIGTRIESLQGAVINGQVYGDTSLPVTPVTPVIDTLNCLAFYPLHIGDYWIYKNYGEMYDPWPPYVYPFEETIVRKIVADSLMSNGHTYVTIIQSEDSKSPQIYYERIDTLTGFVWAYNKYDSTESIIQKLFVNPGDTFFVKSNGSDYFQGEVSYFGQDTIAAFEFLKEQKVYNVLSLWTEQYKLVSDIGLYDLNYGFDVGWGKWKLNGCIVDGIVYGDTSLPSPYSPPIDTMTCLSYYPLKIGNYWVYRDIGSSGFWGEDYTSWNEKYSRQVLADTLMPNGKVYYHIIEKRGHLASLSSYFERVDTLTGFVYSYWYEDSSESVIEKLYAVPGDTFWKEPAGLFSSAEMIFCGMDTITAFGEMRNKKEYQAGFTLFLDRYDLIENIGLFSTSYSYDIGMGTTVLQGALINGILYGDTTITSIKQPKEQISPAEFALHQNFPNPFNPQTTISYALPADKAFYDVTVEIYNALGQKIMVLVSKPQGSGLHTIFWNGRNAAGQVMPSGMYFCILQADHLRAIQKMLMIK